MMLLHCFLLGGIDFGEAGLLVMSWRSWWCCYKELIAKAILFFFIILLLFDFVHPYCYYGTALL
jgi:hypothetical protein